MTSIEKEGNTELNRNFLRNKEREEWERLNKQFGRGSGNKKRDEKVGDKEHEKQEKIERDSVRSDSTNKSFGNALKGVPGSQFAVAGISFLVLEKKQGKNRIVKC
jgi:hypothetical protein